jgi:quinol monooxygenase YgiN
MSTKDTCVTLVPYFEIHTGQVEHFKQVCEKFVELTSSEEKCMFYGFSFCDNEAHCREGYVDAEGVLKHLENVDAPLQEALSIADIIRLEVHGPEVELAKLREPLSALNPKYYVLEYGFRN